MSCLGICIIVRDIETVGPLNFCWSGIHPWHPVFGIEAQRFLRLSRVTNDIGSLFNITLTVRAQHAAEKRQLVALLVCLRSFGRRSFRIHGNDRLERSGSGKPRRIHRRVPAIPIDDVNVAPVLLRLLGRCRSQDLAPLSCQRVEINHSGSATRCRRRGSYR